MQREGTDTLEDQLVRHEDEPEQEQRAERYYGQVDEPVAAGLLLAADPGPGSR
jgi:hypothetical protein